MFKMLLTQEFALALLAWFGSSCVTSAVLGSTFTAFSGGIVLFCLTQLAFACYDDHLETIEEGNL